MTEPYEEPFLTSRRFRADGLLESDLLQTSVFG
jgi:hypothetical protein